MSAYYKSVLGSLFGLSSSKMDLSGSTYKGSRSFCDHLQSTALYESEQDVLNNYASLVLEVSDWLIEKDFRQASLVMDLMLEFKKNKFRDDDVTPSALHEITQAIWCISLLENGLPVDGPEEVLTIIFAHDLGEEFGLGREGFKEGLIVCKCPEDKAEELAEDFDAISKDYLGEDSKAPDGKEYNYYKGIRQRRNASVAKLIDKAHNMMTLIGVKDESKIHIEGAKTLQLLNRFVQNASVNFPSQAKTYEVLQDLINQEAQCNRYHTVDTGQPITDDQDLHRSMPQEAGFKNMPLGLHPLIVIAERARQKHPETHLGPNAKKETIIGDFNVDLPDVTQ